MIMVIMAMNRAQMGANGRVVIPAGIRRELGLEPGEELVVRVRDGRIELTVDVDPVAGLFENEVARTGAGVQPDGFLDDIGTEAT